MHLSTALRFNGLEGSAFIPFLEGLFTPEAGLVGLALSSFLSATLLPGSSEVLLLLLTDQGRINPVLLLSVASVANTLGGMSTYWLGFWSQQKLVKGDVREPSSIAVQRVRRWGAPILVLSWLPIIGDGLCLAAGWLRLAWLPSLAAMLIGKTLRYGALVYGLQLLVG